MNSNVINSYEYKIISQLFLLLPIFIVTGPFLSDLAVSLIAILFILISFRFKIFDLFKSIFFYVFILFYIYLFLRGLFSIDPYNALISLNGPIFYIRYIFFVLGVILILQFNPSLLKVFTRIFLYVVLFVCFDALFQSFFKFNLFGMVTKDTNRLTGLFGKEQILGHYLSYSFPLIFGLLCHQYTLSKKNIFFFLLLLILAEIITFLSGDRAGFFKIFLFTLILLFLSNTFKFLKYYILSIIIIFAMIIINFNETSQKRFNDTIKDLSSTSIPFLPYSPGHEKIFISSYNAFESNILFGIGPQLYSFYCNKYVSKFGECSNHSHNYYFQTLSELGIIGLIFLFIPFLYFSYSLIKQAINIYIYKNSNLMKDYHLILLSALFVIIWPVIPHMSFYNNHFNAMIYLAVAIFCYFLKADEQKLFSR